jgi:deazaflavin-dependent oxidoreductase (nitroreductase family)
MTSSERLYGDEHIEKYLETGGEVGFHWREGTTILVLFTRGRKSGQERRHALIFRPWHDSYLIVASKGGNPKAPEWFLNLQADPNVEVQIKDRRFQAHARVASPEEKAAMWAEMVQAWPHYDEYQTKTDREIPIVVLDPISAN